MKLSKRLAACASLVRRGKRLADIGCDHGYIPVWLVETGVIEYAVAADINEGPLRACRLLVKSMGMEDQIKCVLCDGLDGIDKNEADDILIAGMGGELIADILSRCPYVKSKHLILNPMTHPELARRWLYDNGFEIGNDLVVEDAGHHYSVMDAVYTGRSSEHTPLQEYIGNIRDFSDKAYFEHLIHYLKKKEKGGYDYSEVIAAIEERIQ